MLIEDYTTESLLRYVKDVGKYWDTTHILRRLKFYLAVDELERRGFTWETIENHIEGE